MIQTHRPDDESVTVEYRCTTQSGIDTDAIELTTNNRRSGHGQHHVTGPREGV